MFILKYAEQDALAKEVEQKLQELSLSFKIQKEATLSETTLVDGDHILTGQADIMQHLEDLSGELFTWYYCDC